MIKLIRTSFTIRGKEWLTLKVEFDFTSADFARAQEQARLKSQHTMNAGQNGVNRSAEVKYQKQLMGILAEIACQVYLSQLLESGSASKGKWEVVRYDDIRTDNFRSAKNEYDIKIRKLGTPTTFFNVESRSSITHDRSFEAGLEHYDIIGPYSSTAKGGEGANALYLRPLYRYLDFDTRPFDQLNIESLIISGRTELYLVAGCTFKDMIDIGYNKDMGQSGTQYRCVKISNARDIINFSNLLVNSFRHI